MMNLNKLYSNAWHYMKENGKEELGFGDKVYDELASAVYEEVKQNELFCDDIMFMCIDRFLAEDYYSDELDLTRSNELIQNIIDTLNKNRKIHYLLIPFNDGQLKKDIFFDGYYFINGSEEEKIRKILDITGYCEYDLRRFIEHTKRSRSKDFMEYPMLVLKMNNIHNNVYKNAAYITKRIFAILKLMIYNAETKKCYWEKISCLKEPNYHVAIIGDESWLFGHSNWWNLIYFKYSLDFLQYDDNKVIFKKLMEAFVYTNNLDKLYVKFSNALELFERSLEQKENYNDITLSYLLLFAAAESLLTENKNEKSLRLSIIWPQIVKVSEFTNKELGIMIKNKYNLRNNFVHSGSIIYSDELDNLRIMHQMLAKLIMKYVEDKFDKRITCENEWNKYVNDVFENVIYS